MGGVRRASTQESAPVRGVVLIGLPSGSTSGREDASIGLSELRWAGSTAWLWLCADGGVRAVFQRAGRIYSGAENSSADPGEIPAHSENSAGHARKNGRRAMGNHRIPDPHDSG